MGAGQMKTSCHGTCSTSVSTNQQHRVLRESRGSECTVRTRRKSRVARASKLQRPIRKEEAMDTEKLQSGTGSCGQREKRHWLTLSHLLWL